MEKQLHWLKYRGQAFVYAVLLIVLLFMALGGLREGAAADTKLSAVAALVAIYPVLRVMRELGEEADLYEEKHDRELSRRSK